MKKWERVAIVGVGLIGGSIGLDLLRRGLAKDVVGIGRREASLRTARRVGAISTGTCDLERGVAEADLVVVCTPVGRIVEDVRRAAAACQPGTLLTDAGSTKEAIVAELDAAQSNGGFPKDVRFVGSHPLAGSEKNGPAAALPDLFVGRTVVVTPTKQTRATDERAITRFWTSLGAKVVKMSAADHDRALAATSHLPHLTASALAAATSRCDLPLVAKGWLDSTRIAAGDPSLWTQILLANRTNVLAALGGYEQTLATFRRALEKNDERALEQILLKAKQTRDAVGS
jgi:prephenate dehydrogenase